MAPRDYVKRPQAKKQAQKRNTRNSRSAKAQGLTSVSWAKIAVALLLVALFGAGLYRLKSIDVSDDASVEAPLLGGQNTQQNPVVHPSSSLEEEALPALAPLPVLGEEEWAYIDSLPEYSVEVDAQGPLQSGKEFIMQCGSFRTSDSAEELRAKIAFQGVESRILMSDGGNGRWYRVVLGPYERKRTAERQRHQLRSANINGCKIW